MSDNNLSNGLLPIEEVGIRGVETLNALKEFSTTEILKSLNPEILRKVIDVFEYAKDSLIGAKVDDLSLYEKIELDTGEKIRFAHWLDSAIEEHKEYQSLCKIGGEELASWLGTPGNSKIPQVKSDRDMSDIFRTCLINSIKRIYEEGHEIPCADNAPNLNQCTWWSIRTRPERIAYITWLKEVYETEQDYDKRMSEQIAELNRQSEEERIRAKEAESAKAYFANLQREYLNEKKKKAI